MTENGGGDDSGGSETGSSTPTSILGAQRVSKGGRRKESDSGSGDSE